MSPRGGKRPGAGRPQGPPTVVLSVRVPKRLYKRLRVAVLELVAKILADDRATHPSPGSVKGRTP